MLNPGDINPAQLRAALAEEAQAIETAPPEPVHDGDTGEAAGNEVFLEGDEPLAETVPDPVAETVDPPAAAPVVTEEAGTLDDAVREFMGGDKRMRLGHLDEAGVRAVLLTKRNPDAGDFLGNIISAYGHEAVAKRLGVTVGALKQADAAPVADTPAAPVIDPVALQAEIDTLQDEADAAEASFDYEAKAAKIKELRVKERELRTFEKQKPAATAPVEATPPAVANTAHQAAYDADWSDTTAMWPQLALPEAERAKDPLWKEMEIEHKAMIARGDSAAYSPQINSMLAAKFALKLKLTPGRAAAPSAPASATVPGPVSGAARSGAVAKPVDLAAMRRALTPLTLAAALHGGL